MHLLIFLSAMMISGALLIALLGMLVRMVRPNRTRKPGPPSKVPH